MVYELNYKEFEGMTIDLPSSKSISNRALLLQALSGGGGVLSRLSDCDDTLVTIGGLRQGGGVVDIGAAGTAMRFLTAYFATCPFDVVMTGTARMRQRPIRILVDALRGLGADVAYLEQEGCPPLHIKGTRLRGGVVRLDGSVSSQYVSALMMIAPTLEEGLILEFEGTVVSRPYIEMTAAMMRQWGAACTIEEQRMVIPAGSYQAIDYTIESDWSAASYWYEIVSLSKMGCALNLVGLQAESLQGDSIVASRFETLGVKSCFTTDGVRLQQVGSEAKSVEWDFSSEPDLAQTFAVTCCMKNIPFRFHGLQTLFIKETNRMEALRVELLKFGYVLQVDLSGELSWDGTIVEPQAKKVVHTYEDHRMAMAFAPTILCCNHVSIAEPQVVSKSYPNFWKDTGF